jgi:hypothetical protein
MSELTPCNFCTMSWLRRRAKQEHKQVVVRSKPLSHGGKVMFSKGLDVYVVKKGGKPSKSNWRYWFAELTDHCVC